MTRDPVSEMEIEILCASEADLRARVRELEADVASLRETLSVALDMLHKLEILNARLRTCLRRDLWQTYGRVLATKDRRAA